MAERETITNEQLEGLRAAAGDGPVLILTHDSPDPDALASGKALAILLQVAWGIPNDLVYAGVVARAENRMVMRHLTPEWEPVKALNFELEKYSAVALVDTQPGAGNNRLPEDYLPKIVIDHHQPLRAGLDQVAFADVRPEMGATVTMVYQYLKKANVPIDSVLATAIFYGLQTDTRGLARGASLADEEAYMDLLNLLDRDLLIKVEQAGLPREYYQAFSEALEAAELYTRAIIAYLGKMHRPDLPAEIADLLIRLESAEAVLCYGYSEDTLYLSMRTKRRQHDAGKIVQKIVAHLGKAGGHGTMAGGQISLNDYPLETAVAEIKQRFLSQLHEPGPGEPLLRRRAET